MVHHNILDIPDSMLRCHRLYHMLAPSELSISKGGLHCTLEKPLDEIGEFEEIMSRISHVSTVSMYQRYVKICDIALVYLCHGFGVIFKKWNFSFTFSTSKPTSTKERIKSSFCEQMIHSW